MIYLGVMPEEGLIDLYYYTSSSKKWRRVTSEQAPAKKYLASIGMPELLLLQWP